MPAVPDRSKRQLALLIAGCTLTQIGCATLIKGTSQEVLVTSDPTGADVYVEGERLGQTPMRRDFSHGKAVTFVVKKAGYEDVVRSVTSSFSGHALWLGFLSLLTDAVTGSITTLDDDAVHARLAPASGQPPAVAVKPTPTPTPNRRPGPAAKPDDNPFAAPSKTPPARVRKKRDEILAVFDVEDPNKVMKPADVSQLSDYISSRLSEECGYGIVPRDTVRAALAEAKEESYKACYDESCQIELGKAVAAQKSLASKVLKIGSRCAFSATLINLTTETAEDSASARTKCAVDDLIDAVDKVVVKLCAATANPY